MLSRSYCAQNYAGIIRKGLGVGLRAIHWDLWCLYIIIYMYCTYHTNLSFWVSVVSVAVEQHRAAVEGSSPSV